jgi:serine/threonine protein kinase
MGLPPAAVRSYAHQLLTALTALHDTHAVVHRDVKPSNMLLQQPYVVRTGKVSSLARSMLVLAAMEPGCTRSFGRQI